MSRITRKWSPLINLNGGVDEYHSAGEMKNNRLRGEGRTYDVFIENGRIKLRPGEELYGPYFYDKCYGLHEYIDGQGTAHLFVATKQAVKDVTNLTATDIDTGLSEEELHFHTHRGRCWYNGTSTQRKITQTTAARVGVAAPTNAASAVAAGTGLTGSYSWKYTYAIKESSVVVWESNPSDASASLDLTNQGATVTITASGDSRVNCRKIYRTSASGAVWQYEGEVDDNTTLTFTSGSVTDALLGALLETTHTVPDQGIVSEGCNERMFWLVNESGVAYLDYSEQAHTEAYQEYSPTLNRIRLSGDGKGVGLKRVYNINTDREDLYVFQESGISALLNGDPLSSILTISRTIGAKQQDTIQEYGGSLFFHGNNNSVYMIKAGRLIDLSKRNFPISAKALENTGYCRAAVIFDHYYALSCRRGVGTQQNDTVWLIDLQSIREVKEGEADAICFPWYVPYSYMLQRENGNVLAYNEAKQRLVKLSLNNKYDEYGDGFFCEELKQVPLNGVITGKTGSTSIQFDLFTAETGGTTLWTETHTVVIGTDGAFTVALNTSTAIPATVITGMAAGTSYYLQLTIAGEALTRMALPKRTYLNATGSSTTYTVKITGVTNLAGHFATRFFGAENPSARKIAALIRVEGKQERKICITPEYRDFYRTIGTESNIQREAGGTVFVNEATPAPGTQIAMGMEESLEPGDGGSVSLRFEKNGPDSYFEFEGLQFLYTELQRGV